VPAAPPASAATGALDAAALRRLWPEVLDIVKPNRRTRALLDNAQVLDLTGHTLRISAPRALAAMIAEDSNMSVLRAALTKLIGGEWQVHVESSSQSADATGSGRAEEPDPRDEEDEPAPPQPPSDPEADAIQLLRDKLGATPIERA
jgi:DNA polymerase-3 subunit gamma/tau